MALKISQEMIFDTSQKVPNLIHPSLLVKILRRIQSEGTTEF